MSVTVFILLIVAAGGWIFLHGLLPKGAIAAYIDNWTEARANGKLQRHRRNKGKKKLTNSQRQRAEVLLRKKLAEKNRYRAVSIKCGKNPCSSAIRMEGRRALVAQFPKLPLLSCDAAKCECTYVHHGDRRGGKDRRDVMRSLSNDNDARFSSFKSRSGRDRRRNNRLDDELKALDISYD